MIRGIFTSASSMMARSTLQEIISNNLANINTVGYKRDRIAFRNTLDASNLLADDPNFTGVEFVQTEFEMGALKQTDNPLDVAIEGQGFFVVSDLNGQTFLTRNGNFELAPDGSLQTTNGYQVMGEEGPLLFEKGEIAISKDGMLYADKEVIGRLLVVNVPDKNALLKAGYNMFTPEPGSADPAQVEAKIQQGYLEESNVNTIEEMVNLIMVSRDYNQNQKSIQTQDSTLQKAVNELGRV